VGFVDVVECRYQRTASRFPEIAELGNREDESLFVEASGPADASQCWSILGAQRLGYGRQRGAEIEQGFGGGIGRSAR
jgi:hypothetical protein